MKAAVTAYSDALEERSYSRSPHGWADSQDGLAQTLAELGKAESGTERLIASIALFEDIFRVLSARRSQVDWAFAVGNQGDALLALASRTDDLSSAERALQQLSQAQAYLQIDKRTNYSANFYAALILQAQTLVDRLKV